MDAPNAPAMLPIPRQSHQQGRRKSTLHVPPPSLAVAPLASRRLSPSHAGAVPPASPEVISSLITSLSVISKPASSHFDGPLGSHSEFGFSPADSLSPAGGSFGVDYGAYSNTVGASVTDTGVSLDELAASPPVIRTAKPPSGFSPLTAPKSPVRDATTLKSFISGRSTSRPSSKGSQVSRDADAQSIGNLSIERGTVSPTPKLRRKSSHDSWDKKAGRAQKGLMYMSSRERLREKEAEKKRASLSVAGSDRLSNGGSISPRPDPFLAETAIREETQPETPSKEPRRSSDTGGLPSPRPIPTRDSSLHKTGSVVKRSSRRSSQQKPEATTNETIQEVEEQRLKQPSATYQRPDIVRNHSYSQQATQPPAQDVKGKQPAQRFETEDAKMPPYQTARPNGTRRSESLSYARPAANGTQAAPEDDVDDGAPFPAVAQGRRRDQSFDGGWRRSGQNTPEPTDRVKRSGSKLKRLSAPLSPRAEETHNTTGTSDGVRNSRASVDDTHVVYERPESADSIDDAVEAYLCSPRLSQKIRHPQTGRVISFSEVGDSDGSAVFCCVGMGLTRYITAFYDELALTLKLRLITPDRPGVGDSEPYADGTATPLSWPDDVYAICQALKITKFSILAHSAGAIYALATALRMPQHIRGRIHLLAPWIPPSQMSVFGSSTQTPLPPTNAIPTSQRILRALPTPLLKAANSSFMSATSSSITSSLPKTPKRKRKSNANQKDRDKDTGKNSPIPPEVNKENQLLNMDDNAPPQQQSIPSRDLASMEQMDRVRPHGTTSTSTADAAAVASEEAAPAKHKKSMSGASVSGTRTSRDAREAAVLAAAATALADRERQATYDTRLTHAIWELATTGANPAVDLLVCLERRHTIGFRYVDITRPVVIHHGSRDTRVPVENVRWLGKTMRRCEVRVLEGEGHGLMASASVMGGILMEISKEWEDWSRLTGATGRNRQSVREDRERRIR